MLLGLSGSLRRESANTRLVREAGRVWGGEFVLADLRVPLYDEDVQHGEGIPEAVRRLSERVGEAEAVVISTPEYNQSLSGVLKNALDWVSRVEGNPWADKPVALMSASSGRSGGARGNSALRLAMTAFRPRLVTYELMLGDARNQFDAEGRLVSERYRASLDRLIGALRDEVERGRMSGDG